MGFYNTLQWNQILYARKCINLRGGMVWSIQAPKVAYNQEFLNLILDPDEMFESSMGGKGGKKLIAREKDEGL